MVKEHSNHNCKVYAGTGTQFLTLKWSQIATSSTSWQIEVAGHFNSKMHTCLNRHDQQPMNQTPSGPNRVGSPLERGLATPLIVTDAIAVEVGGTGSKPGWVSGQTIGVAFFAVSDQWELNDNGKMMGSETSDSASAPGDWRSGTQTPMRQQVCEVAQLHQSV